jgi:hypothetical protein
MGVAAGDRLLVAVGRLQGVRSSMNEQNCAVEVGPG